MLRDAVVTKARVTGGDRVNGLVRICVNMFMSCHYIHTTFDSIGAIDHFCIAVDHVGIKINVAEHISIIMIAWWTDSISSIVNSIVLFAYYLPDLQDYIRTLKWQLRRIGK